MKQASAVGDFAGLIAQIRRALLPDTPETALTFLETAESDIRSAADEMERSAREHSDV
jgi:hypothetical protein